MHCVYCAQDRQTGRSASSPIPAILAEAEHSLSTLPSCTESGPRELAFYGGTFTALPEAEREACLAAAQAARFTGEAADPTPATAVAELMPFIAKGIARNRAGSFQSPFYHAASVESIH